MNVQRNRARLLGVAVAGAALMLAPYAWNGSLGTSSAFAQGNSGGGNSGGNGGGSSGGGNSGGNGNAGGNSGNSGNAGNSGNSGQRGNSGVGVSTSRDSTAIGRGNSSNAGATASAHGRAANELGNLNAAHASATARGNAAPGSMVGQIAAYETAMKSALAIEDPAQRAAAITAARQDLALSANKQLTTTAVTRVDSMLGLPASPATLGTSTATTGRSSSNTSTTSPSQTSAQGKAAASLGNLNAAHASATARSNAAPGSIVGQIAAYETAMKSALAIENPTQRAAAITAARQDLALTANKQLTPAAVTRVDSLLDLPASPAELGTTTTTATRR